MNEWWESGVRRTDTYEYVCVCVEGAGDVRIVGVAAAHYRRCVAVYLLLTPTCLAVAPEMRTKRAAMNGYLMRGRVR